MATAEQVKALIRTHADGDDERFFTVALQVAAHAARSGHKRFARDLRDLIDTARASRENAVTREPAKVLSIVQPRGELAGLLSVEHPSLRLSAMALDPVARDRLKRVLTEQRSQGRLEEFGLRPIRKLLLIGPPGTGKTMTAGALAAELSLPLFTIQLDGLITKYMGETATKLRLIFDAMRQTRALFLFDEFDAVGSNRSASNDVGEVRRVLNSFLLFLEQDDSHSLIVCATNHPALLDPALFRRFDLVVEYGFAGEQIAESVIRSRLALLNTDDLDWRKIRSEAAGMSHADIARACESAAKDAILAGRQMIDTETLLRSIGERKSMRAQ